MDSKNRTIKDFSSFENFSKEELIQVANLYAKLMMAIDGFWYLAIMNKVDNKTALDCDLWAWRKEVKYELKRTTELFGIKGNDVKAVMQALAASPWLHTVKYQVDFKNDNDAVLTITDCPTLTALEKEGTGREKNICNIVEIDAFTNYASYFNPDIKVIPLYVPPRKEKGPICCQWQFKL